MRTLQVGDKVLWRGGFGSVDERVATVERIEHTEGGKYGKVVERANWADMVRREYVVSLDNGHWAYAEQIKPFDE